MSSFLSSFGAKIDAVRAFLVGVSTSTSSEHRFSRSAKIADVRFRIRRKKETYGKKSGVILTVFNKLFLDLVEFRSEIVQLVFLEHGLG